MPKPYQITLEIEADSPREAVRILFTKPLQLLITGKVVEVVDASTGQEHHINIEGA